jgi:hypothetical protein
LIESDSLVGTKCVNALSGTGIGNVVLLLLELDPPPPPPPDDAVVDERVVPLAEVFALEDVPVLLLVLVNTFVFVALFAEVESAEPELTLAVADVVFVFPLDSADVAALDGTPLLCEGVSCELLDELLPCPAPDDEPAVFEAVIGVVPDVDACT